MEKRILITLFFISVLFSGVFSQEREITGTVTDPGSKSANNTIPGVNVTVVGTAQGSTTDFNGKYTISVSDETEVKLQFSYIGYVTQIITVGEESVINVALEVEATQMDEIVVTALGIKREKKALGYSATDIKGDALTEARESNIMNSISGKVAGVQISKTAGGAGGSSRVVIRGNSSISGNNQALIVVDGVPIDNSNHQTAGWTGGLDYGDGISDINPDDVESMTVLKGPNAAALYGSRAANGVIIITTKKGTTKKGIGVSINSSTTIDIADIQADYQNEYGLGGYGNIPRHELTEEQQLLYPGYTHLRYALDAYQSWGPKIEGNTDTVLHWNGEIRPLQSNPNNVKDYFEPGYTTTNSVSIDGGTEKATFRLSYTNLYNKGMRENSWFKRNSLNFRGTSKLTEKLSVDAKVNYVRGEAFNRPGQGDSKSGARTFIWMPRNIDINKLKEDYKDEYGYEQNFYKADAWHTNPYWELHENTNEDAKDRIIGTVKLDYKFNDWLSLMMRSGTDFYKDRRKKRIASYSKQATEGRYSESWIGYRSMNSDFLFIASQKFGDFDASLNFGGNMMSSRVDVSSSTIQGLAVPNFFSLNNYTNKLNNSTGTSLRRQNVNSLYGFTQIAYKSFLYLDINARNDWSSTLPLENGSYFYPSVNLSCVISEALNIKSSVFTFGKVRISWAKVGSDADPHILKAYYVPSNYGEFPVSYLSNTLPLSDLKPETTESWEAGADLRLFQNRVGLDMSVYKSNTYDQILQTEVSKSTGFDKATINAGEVENRGIEFLLSLKPIKSTNFNWDFNINFSANKSKVISLEEDINTYPITSTSQIFIEARPGDPYGNIVGTYCLTDSVTGKRLIDPVTGLYMGSNPDTKILGNINPDWTGGIVSTMSYKNFTFSFTVGIQIGGDIYSKTNKYGMDNGQFANTVEGRDSWYAATTDEQFYGREILSYDDEGVPVEFGDPVGYVPEGVFPDGTPNNRGLDPQDYWHQGKWNGITELSIYDASYVKLREMVIGYKFSKTVTDKLNINNASISLVGRNLWLIYSGVPNIDPESSFSNQNNGLGQEYAAMPSARSIGFTLKFNF